MKEVKQFKNIQRLLFVNKPLIQESHSASFVNEDLTLELLVEDDIYYSKVLNNELFFQTSDENNLNIKLDGSLKTKNGLWGLITAFSVTDDTIYIFHQESDHVPKFLILNKELEIVTESVKGCNYAVKNYLFRCFGNKIICFETETGKILWEIVQENSFDQNSFLLNDNYVFACLKSGELLVMNISTGVLVWSQKLAGRIVLFDEKIYCITGDLIKELDANTGETLKEASIQGLTKSCDFRPTGEHKVYEDYIFSMSSGKPGMVAVFDRSTLKFQEMITLEGMIPVGQDNLIWHEGKLFILDGSKILHIFEKE